MKKIITMTSVIIFLSYILLGINVESIAETKQSETTKQTTLVAPTEYKDWSEFTELDINYSYSKIFYNDTTEIKIIKNDGSESWRWENDMGLPNVTLRKGQEAIVLITDCTINKKGKPLDAVIKVNNIKEWDESSNGVVISVGVGEGKLNSQSNPKGKGKNGYGYDYLVTPTRGELIAFRSF